MEYIPCPLKQAVNACPNKTAIQKGDISISFKKLDELVDQIAYRFIPFEGKKIAIHAKDPIRIITLLFACLKKNITPLFFSTRWTTFQIKQEIETSKCDLFLYEDLAVEFLNIPSSSISALFEKRNGKDSTSKIKSNASLVLYTSSSISFSKACNLEILGLFISAKTVCTETKLNHDSNVYLCLPLFHVAGISLVLRAFLKAATLYLPKHGLIEDLSLHPITHVSLVPTQLYHLLQETGKKMGKIVKHMKCLLVGGAPIGQNLLKKAKKNQLPLYITYGMTEAGSSIFIKKNPIIENGRTYLGMPLPHLQVSLSDQNELLVKGTSLFKGYLQRGELSLPLQKMGWFSTKDLARYFPDKGFCILGRKDHQFISGGENVQPEYIEQELMSLEDVIEAIVVPIQDAEFGQRPVAFIQTKIEKKKIIESLRKKLPKYQIPIHFFDLKTAGFGEIKRKRKDLITRAEENISKKNFSR